VPYVKNTTPYYFQARKLSVNGIKYINPTKEHHGVKSSEILYPFDKRKNYVVITEGPIDALTLQLNGVNATSTQGCHISYAQLNMLKGKKLIFSYDNDEAGREGLMKARKVCLARNFSEIYTCSPPLEYKDWNDFHIGIQDRDAVFKQFEQNVQKMDFEYFATSQLL
jgi:DNA primase